MAERSGSMMRLLAVVLTLGAIMVYTTFEPISWGTVSLRELTFFLTSGWGWGAASGNAIDCIKDMLANPMPKKGEEDDGKCANYKLARLGFLIHSAFAAILAAFCVVAFALMRSSEPVVDRIQDVTSLLLPFTLIAISVGLTWLSNFARRERKVIHYHMGKELEKALATPVQKWDGVTERREKPCQ